MYCSLKIKYRTITNRIKKSENHNHHFVLLISFFTTLIFLVLNISTLQTTLAQNTPNNAPENNNPSFQQSNNNNNNQNLQGSNSIGNNFVLSGPLSSFLSTPTGNWVVNGSWALKVQNGNLLFFRGFMQWDPTNLEKLSHSHSFVNFKPDSNNQNSIFLGPNRIMDIKGIMDIGANNNIEWVNVPAEIKTSGNTITISILDDSQTGNHFNNYPIFGKISTMEICTDSGQFGENMDYNPNMVKCSL